MTKAEIAALLFKMKKMHQSLITISGQIFSADELLTMYVGHPIGEDVGQQFVAQDKL